MTARAAASTPAAMTLDVLRSKTSTVLHVAGHLSGSGHHHLADTLQWLLGAGDRAVTVHLETVGGADSACLQLLRQASTNLTARQGQLFATSSYPETRAALATIGLTAALN